MLLVNKAAMARFRRCLRQEIASRLAVLPGVASPDAVEYKKKVLKLSVKKATVKRVQDDPVAMRLR